MGKTGDWKGDEGFSIVEILIVAGLISTVSLGMASMMEFSHKAQNGIELRSLIQDRISAAVMLLARPEKCMEALRIKTPSGKFDPTPTAENQVEIGPSATVAILREGDLVGRGVTFTRVRAQAIGAPEDLGNGDQRYFSAIRIQAVRDVTRAMGSNVRNEDVHVYITLDSTGTMIGCAGVGDHSKYVLKTGDSMSGALRIAAAQGNSNGLWVHGEANVNSPDPFTVATFSFSKLRDSGGSNGLVVRGNLGDTNGYTGHIVVATQSSTASAPIRMSFADTLTNTTPATITSSMFTQTDPARPFYEAGGRITFSTHDGEKLGAHGITDLGIHPRLTIDEKGRVLIGGPGLSTSSEFLHGGVAPVDLGAFGKFYLHDADTAVWDPTGHVVAGIRWDGRLPDSGASGGLAIWGELGPSNDYQGHLVLRTLSASPSAPVRLAFSDAVTGTTPGNITARMNGSASSDGGTLALSTHDGTNMRERLIVRPDGSVVVQSSYAACTIGLSSGVSCSSDRRLKQEIETLPDALDSIRKLRGVEFHWRQREHDRVSPKQKEIGVIAQEVEQVFPSLVSTDEKTGFKSVAYSGLVAPLIEAIKSLANKLDEEIGRRTETESKLTALQSQLDSQASRLKDLEERLGSRQ